MKYKIEAIVTEQQFEWLQGILEIAEATTLEDAQKAAWKCDSSSEAMHLTEVSDVCRQLKSKKELPVLDDGRRAP